MSVKPVRLAAVRGLPPLPRLNQREARNTFGEHTACSSASTLDTRAVVHCQLKDIDQLVHDIFKACSVTCDLSLQIVSRSATLTIAEATHSAQDERH